MTQTDTFHGLLGMSPNVTKNHQIGLLRMFQTVPKCPDLPLMSLMSPKMNKNNVGK